MAETQQIDRRVMNPTPVRITTHSHKKQVYVMFGTIGKKLSAKELQNLMKPLPEELQTHIWKYKKRDNMQASVIGKLLLLDGLKTLYGLSETEIFEHLTYNQYNRPYLNGKEIDFNIAHSDKMVICAFSGHNKVGVDIQKIRPVHIDDFLKEFTGQELTNITRAQNQYCEFFSQWTKKEALLKGEGLGLGFPLTQIHFNYSGDEGEVLSNKWYLNPLNINKKYCGWLATDHKISPTDIDIRSVSYSV